MLKVNSLPLTCPPQNGSVPVNRTTSSAPISANGIESSLSPGRFPETEFPLQAASISNPTIAGCNLLIRLESDEKRAWANFGTVFIVRALSEAKAFFNFGATAMKATPLFLGACVIASIAGAVGGATTNTTPILNGGIGSDLLPERSIAFDPSDSGLPNVATPDHYAMVTPAGRIEVAELSTRGLYAQRRFGWDEPEYVSEAAPEYFDEPVEEIQQPAPAITAQPVADQVQPLDLTEPAEASGPRIIDVAAELAAAG